MHATWRYVIIVICIALPVVYPYLIKGYPVTDDGVWAMVRLSEMHREIRDLQFPPQWSNYLNHGFGYPLFLFTYPFPYYLGEIAHIFGLGVISTIKLLFIISTLLSAIFLFLFLNEQWGKWSGFLGTALFLYAPYRLVNLYTRGSLGEVMAGVFFPLIFIGCLRLSKSQSTNNVLFLTIIYSALILTHNASVLLFTPFMLLWICFLFFQKKVQQKTFLVSACISIVLALLITAYFWLPAIAEKKYIALSLNPLTEKANHFLSISTLFGYSLHITTGLPLRVGIEILGIGSLLMLNIFKSEKSKILFFLMLTLISFILVTTVSESFWKLPLMKDIDFPWRMLGIYVFFASILASIFARFRYGWSIVVVTVVSLIIFNNNAIQNVPHQFRSDVYFETNDATTTSNDELMPIWVKDKPRERPSEFVSYSSNNAATVNYYESSQKISFLTKINDPTIVTMNKLYFPGWKVFVNGNMIEMNTTLDTGLIQFSLNPGQHAIQLKFTNTPIRFIANLISIISIFGVLGLWIFSKKASLLY